MLKAMNICTAILFGSISGHAVSNDAFATKTGVYISAIHANINSIVAGNEKRGICMKYLEGDVESEFTCLWAPIDNDSNGRFAYDSLKEVIMTAYSTSGKVTLQTTESPKGGFPALIYATLSY